MIATHVSDSLTLTASQYQHYQTGCISLYAPDGKYLENFGHNIQLGVAEDARHRLREQLAFTSALLAYINQDIELSTQAVAGLAELVWRVSVEMEKS